MCTKIGRIFFLRVVVDIPKWGNTKDGGVISAAGCLYL